jgi:adenylate kinase family enzyme
MKKIIILGGCGHGKTHLAKQISNITKISCYDLDKVTFNEKFTGKVSDSLRDKRLKSILKNKKWIIEGPYAGKWINPAIKKSDLIIVLKINPLIATKRVISRFIKIKLGKNKDRNWSIAELPRIIKYAYGYVYDYYPKHIKIVKDFNKRYIILKNKNQIDKFLSKLKN